MIKNICVFCGARDTIAEEYKNLARICGIQLAKHDLTLVYGAGYGGLMRETSDAAFHNNGHVIGVYPRILAGAEPMNENVSELFIVDTMAERKNMMIEKSDAFIVLPGGIGTLDEAFEVITLNAIGSMHKPLIFVNHNHYWDDAKKLINKIINEGFARANLYDCFCFVDTLQEAFKRLGYEYQNN